MAEIKKRVLSNDYYKKNSDAHPGKKGLPMQQKKP